MTEDERKAAYKAIAQKAVSQGLIRQEQADRLQIVTLPTYGDAGKPTHDTTDADKKQEAYAATRKQAREEWWNERNSI